MTRILITGANGQVGFELQRALAPLGEILACDRQQLDLADSANLEAVLDRFQPDIIVNPAAYTAVDRAESEQDVAMAINAQAPARLADWATRHNALLVHYSTDYVFDGQKDSAYVEDDATNPQSVYGRSKWEGEQAIRASGCRYLILRTSWVVGAHGNNFLKTILRLARERTSLSVVADQFGAPTSAALIADVTSQLLGRYLHQPAEVFPFGTYHLTASGSTSWYDYARHVIGLAEQVGFELALHPDTVQPIPTSGYPLPAPRPANSRLDCTKLTQTFGLALPNWRQGIDYVFAQLND
ncbi:dTDP-4-dehydrorhamnose reductase [Crenobacter sp. SG2303]|uniref:dTDP-4-dehydrorhamnose reductase n=1 Tax=Crenobacter oryzisoli TaxID=3056844 RepID=A0ABT7XSS7_9NEIS|nr:dTDP-4-dehydrorhamnose reductase [Crenobacter sp. SG2303]MDN0076851.1 dTDP-4-dehydrorhamnose reductase [Crenobacter sp. SG2303]